MFLAEDKFRLRKAMQLEGLEELRFKFDFDGAKAVLS
jgi:D-glycero-alpha-D-manno-heptose-7-phosphate kinase